MVDSLLLDDDNLRNTRTFNAQINIYALQEPLLLLIARLAHGQLTTLQIASEAARCRINSIPPTEAPLALLGHLSGLWGIAEWLMACAR